MVCNDFSDCELVRMYISGKEEALSILVSRHKERLFGFILSKVKDRQLAEDIFQEMFFKAIVTLKKGRYNEEGKFLPWIMRIARNLVIDHFRASAKVRTTSGTETFDIFDIIADKSETAFELKEKQETAKVLQKLLTNLPPDQLEVVRMRIFLDMSFKEIAEETNVSINTALGRMRYGVMNLRKLVDKHNLTFVS